MTEIAKTEQEPSTDNLVQIGEMFAASGMFQGSEDKAKCVTKLIIGRSLGLDPLESMTGINMIQGKPTLSAQAMAAAIKRSGRYDYRVTEKTNERCTVVFYDLTQRDSEGVPNTIGETTFSLEDARQANLANGQNWRKYPRAMLFARAISEGYRTHCPDALGFGPVYVEEHGETEIPSPKKEQPEEQPKEDGGHHLAFARVSVLLQNRKDGDEIRQKALAKAGVEYLDQLTLEQLERMHTWLEENPKP